MATWTRQYVVSHGTGVSRETTLCTQTNTNTSTNTGQKGAKAHAHYTPMLIVCTASSFTYAK